MPKITGSPMLTGAQIYSSSATGYSFLDLGQRVKGSNGTEFRYVLVDSGAALVVGNCIQSPAYTTTWNALTPAAAAPIGQTYVDVTNAASAVTVDQWKDGTLTVDTTPGLGQTFTIVGNTADAVGSATVRITLKEPIRVALTTVSRVTPRLNPCMGVIQTPITTLTGTPVGVAIYPIPASQYGFVQTKGVAAVLSDGTSIIMGSAVSGLSGTTAGKCALGLAGVALIGRAMQAASDGHTIPVDLDM